MFLEIGKISYIYAENIVEKQEEPAWIMKLKQKAETLAKKETSPKSNNISTEMTQNLKLSDSSEYSSDNISTENVPIKKKRKGLISKFKRNVLKIHKKTKVSEMEQSELEDFKGYEDKEKNYIQSEKLQNNFYLVDSDEAEPANTKKCEIKKKGWIKKLKKSAQKFIAKKYKIKDCDEDKNHHKKKLKKSEEVPYLKKKVIKPIKSWIKLMLLPIVLANMYPVEVKKSIPYRLNFFVGSISGEIELNFTWSKFVMVESSLKRKVKAAYGHYRKMNKNYLKAFYVSLCTVLVYATYF
jgi:hypothetical protein